MGRTGMTYEGYYPDYDRVAFSLPEAGAVSDPFVTVRGWAIVKLEEIQDAKMPTLEEATMTIKKTLQEIRSQELIEEKLAIWREGYPIVVDDKNLAKARLARTKP
jgi:parvulin-like peptidyl-prolyl isomerase